MTEQTEMTLAEAITTEAALKTLLDEVKARYDIARGIVQAGLDAQQRETGGTRFDAMVPGPDGAPLKVGTVSLTTGSAVATVTDATAFEAWVRERYPSEVSVQLVRSVRAAWQTEFLAKATAAGATVDTETGEEVPGVEMRAARSRTHSVRFAKDGRGLVGEAWRQGLLGRVLPALAPAPAAEPGPAEGECGAREPEPRTGTQACVRPAGHGGSRHRDHWGNEWPTAADDTTDGGDRA